jgi:hypothetical protein
MEQSAYAHRPVEEYSLVVVIAPNQVHTTDDDAMKIIYDKTATKTRFDRGMGSWKGILVKLGFADYKGVIRKGLCLCCHLPMSTSHLNQEMKL